MRRYGRTDSNHTEIVEAFQRLGCSVLSLASVGGGAPDLAVGYGGFTCLVEVKDGSKPAWEIELNDNQKRFRDKWKGGIRLVKDMEGVAQTVNLLRKWSHLA